MRSELALADAFEAASAQPPALGIRPNGPAAIRFRDCAVYPGQRLLLRDGEAVEIGSRAFDLLVVLLRSRGAVVQKREIVDYVWPSTIVDESNLRFQVACLRRALGDDRDVIKTIQGRGYMFVAGLDDDETSSAIDPGASPNAAAWLGSEWEETPGPTEPTALAQVAVIEDDDDTREALDGLLRSSGLSPQCFASTQAFMRSMATSKARCLVLDVCLPGRSGLDFHAEMRREGFDLPVIFISGHADIPMSVRAMKAGAIEFLTKPVRHEELLRAVNSVVGRRSAP